MSPKKRTAGRSARKGARAARPQRRVARQRAAALRAVDRRFAEFQDVLCELVRVPGVSAAGFPAAFMRRSARSPPTCCSGSASSTSRSLEVTDAPPYVYADWLHAPGAPTVLVYGHHDVVPPGATEKWMSPPFAPVVRKGRLYGRGTADDKGGFMAWLAAASAYLGAAGALPVNLKLLIEGEEEIGSAHLADFLKAHRSKLDADVLVLSDTSNFATGVPALTWQLRGIVQVDVEVTLPRAAGPQRRLRRGRAGRGAHPVPHPRRPARARRLDRRARALPATWCARARACAAVCAGCRSPRRPSVAVPACCPGRGSCASAATRSTSRSGRGRR